MIDSNRKEFEKLLEIAEKIKRSRLNFSKLLNRYLTSTMSDDDQFDCDFVNGAKWSWEYQQKKLDGCREEYKAHLEKIDELKARIDVYELHIKTLKNIHENDFNEESESRYILGNLDGFFECIEADLKGNKDEN